MTRWLLLAAMALGGCSGGGGGNGGDGGASDLAGGASTDLAGGGGAGGGGGTGGSGGGGGTGAALYPLAVGYRWTYAVSAVGAGAICAAGNHDQHVVSANAAGGRAAFQLDNFCSGVGGTYDYSQPGGDEVDFYYNATWAPIIDLPLQEGHMWTYFNSSYTWHRETSITVPAGTYSDCWTANQNVTYTAYLTYCRGVGLVRSYSQDLAGNGWDAQLASKSF
ncbi:MAG: hypothetical protein ACXVCV_03690 [Polyangia bacterium]